MSARDSRRPETLAVHGGQDRSTLIERALITPIFQTSTFEHSPAEDGSYGPVRYTRLSNGPNHTRLQRRLALLTGQDEALVCGSGMAAVSGALLATVVAGERIFFQRGLYGGTQIFYRQELPRRGIGVDIATSDDVATWRAQIQPNTKVIYVEAIANPMTTLIDLAAVVALAREIGALAVIDATFASPVNFRPAELGFDLEVHSASKYLNGHSDLIAGLIAGRGELMREVWATQARLGAVLDPHACFLLERGLKTLTLRVRQQNATALGLARHLTQHPSVEAVHYPGLAPERSVPGSIRPYFHGFGGVLSFATTPERAQAFLRKTELAVPGPSLGGPETLITVPATTSHAAVPSAERLALGISDGLVRVSCGLEALEDLIADFDAALA